MSDEKRFGFVAIVGAPNAGKSTLLNHIIGAKISIVTPKAQTTRGRVLGVVVAKNAQMVLVDTPGIFPAEEEFDKAMVSAAKGSLQDADAVLWMLDVTQIKRTNVEAMLELLASANRPTFLALNKVDQIKDKRELLDIASRFSKAEELKQIFMISALNGDGVDDVRDTLAATMPEGVWHYPEDHMTEVSERMLAAEITREKLLLRLQEEVPHQLWVETEQFKTAEDGVVELHQSIVVVRESQKKIVIGHKGQTIKEIGIQARRDIQKALDCKVRLNLFVKVEPHWREQPEAYHHFGLEFKAKK